VRANRISCRITLADGSHVPYMHHCLRKGCQGGRDLALPQTSPPQRAARRANVVVEHRAVAGDARRYYA
jgi:hypothetical protein